jgi:copper oxidase (laccase) domain-containing protein
MTFESTKLEMVTNPDSIPYIKLVMSDGNEIVFEDWESHVYDLPGNMRVAFSKKLHHFHHTRDRDSQNALEFVQQSGIDATAGLVGMGAVHKDDIYVATPQPGAASRIDDVDILMTEPAGPALHLAPADCNGLVFVIPGVGYCLIHAGRDGLGMGAIAKGIRVIMDKWLEANPTETTLNLDEIAAVLPPQVNPDSYVMRNDGFRTKENSWWANHPELIEYRENEDEKKTGYYLNLEQGAILQLSEAIAQFVADHPEVTAVGDITLYCATLYTGGESGLASHSEAADNGTAGEFNRNIVAVGPAKVD